MRWETRETIRLVSILGAVSAVAIAAVGTHSGGPELAAARALAAGRDEVARIELRRVLAEEPDRLDIRERLLGCLLALGRDQETAVLAAETLRRHSRSAPAREALCRLAVRRGDLDEAIEQARRATTADGASPGHGFLLADLLFEAGRLFEGAGALAEAVRAEWERGEIGLRSAAILAVHGNREARRQARRRLDEEWARLSSRWERGDRAPSTRRRLALIARVTGRPSGALLPDGGAEETGPAVARGRLEEWRRRAAEVEGPARPEVLDGLLGAAVEVLAVRPQDETARAVQWAVTLERSAELPGADFGTHFLLALIAAREGRLADARRFGESALRLRPEAPEAINNLAWVLAQSPETADRAVELARRAVEAEPGNEEFRDTLALAYRGATR